MDDPPLKQALYMLTLAEVWELAPDNSEAPRRDGLRKSPFEDDRKPSFSVFDGMHRYKLHDRDDKPGGVWTFVQACRPDWSKKDVARYLVERAGLEWKEGSGQKVSRSQWAREQAEARRVKDRRIYENRIRKIDTPSKLKQWPKFIADHYCATGPDTHKRIRSLAKRRGWPENWIEFLHQNFSLSWPKLPWSDKHFPAFRVDDQDGMPIGYHQRIWTQTDGPSWLYVPYRPKSISNTFTRHLADYGVCTEGRMVPPLPFVLGERSASLWIITEGQWDAVTVFGLLGGFDDQFDLPIAVFGLRGAEAGPSVFLSHYQYLIRRHKPQIWLMPDNDKAGNAWDGRGRASNFAAPQKETFTDTLRRMLPGRRFPVSRAPKQYGTDFNDFYKNGKPSRDMLLRELERHFPSWIQTLTH